MPTHNHPNTIKEGPTELITHNQPTQLIFHHHQPSSTIINVVLTRGCCFCSYQCAVAAQYKIVPTDYEGIHDNRGLKEYTHRALALAKPGATARLLELLALTVRAPTPSA